MILELGNKYTLFIICFSTVIRIVMCKQLHGKPKKDVLFFRLHKKSLYKGLKLADIRLPVELKIIHSECRG